MATYSIQLELKLNDDSHPRKWLPETISEALHNGEDIIDYDIKEIETSLLEVKDFIRNTVKNQKDLSDHWDDLIDDSYNFITDSNGNINVYAYPLIKVNGARIADIDNESLVAIVIDGSIYFAD